MTHNMRSLRIEDWQSGPTAILESYGLELSDTQDVLDLIGECMGEDAYRLIIERRHLIPTFFDLSTGIAGDMLQKFSNYNTQLAIIGDFSDLTSKSIQDFIRESNRVGRVFFVGSENEAFDKLAPNDFEEDD